MSTPDHCPYLLPDDLQTVEDVLAWLDAEAAAWREPGIAHGAELVRFDIAVATTLQMAAAHLRARLDRERRLACRKGALEAWRAFRKMMPRRSENPARRLMAEGLVWLPSNVNPASLILHLAEWRVTFLGHLADALAFRAAARTP